MVVVVAVLVGSSAAMKNTCLSPAWLVAASVLLYIRLIVGYLYMAVIRCYQWGGNSQADGSSKDGTFRSRSSLICFFF